MQKTELIEQVAKEAGVTRTEADKVVRATLRVIQSTLATGDKINLIGFGTFQVRNRNERSGTNIRTKEKITIPASKVAAFSAGSELKAAVNGTAKAPKEVATGGGKKAGSGGSQKQPKAEAGGKSKGTNTSSKATK